MLNLFEDIFLGFLSNGDSRFLVLLDFLSLFHNDRLPLFEEFILTRQINNNFLVFELLDFKKTLDKSHI